MMGIRMTLRSCFWCSMNVGERGGMTGPRLKLPLFGVRDDLVHVERRGGVEHGVAVGYGDHAQRIGTASCSETGSVYWIHTDVDAGPRPVPTSSPLYSIGAASFSPSPMTILPAISMVER